MHLGSQLARVQSDSGPSFTVEALASVLKPELISEALETFGKHSERIRKLPARLVVWLVVSMGLYRGLSIDNVLYQLVQGVGITVNWRDGKAPGSDAITKARGRLGWEVVRYLFRKLAELLRTRFAVVDKWKDLDLLAIDGTTFMTPDTEENEGWFGRPRGSRGDGAYPRIRLVALMGACSHLLFAVTFGAYSTSELACAKYLLTEIKTGTLVLMDRLYYSFALLAAFEAQEKGRHFLVRGKTGKRDMPARKVKKLGEGDWLGFLRRPAHLKTGLPARIKVRIIEYQFEGFPTVRLVTSLLDPVAYPAEELILRYHDRWEIELGYDEIKTHFAREQVVFRSKAPAKVLQEAYGLLLAYNCVRALMAEAAKRADVEPRQLSFVDCLVRIRFALTKMALAPTRRLPALYEELLTELASCVLRPRRSERVYPRAVKIKMSSFPLKRNQKGRGRAPHKKSK